MIDRDGLGRHLSLSCTPKKYGAERKTSLDFTLGYVPAGANAAVGTVKWVCGSHAQSVSETRNFNASTGTLDVERALWGPYRAVPYDVPADKVQACTVGGHPAVCMHPQDDATGKGESHVLVIEDDTMSPYATILRINASEIPFSEVLRVAEGIR